MPIDLITRNIWRGPRPKSLEKLQAAGFQRVISLQSGMENALTDSVYEFQDPSDFGLEWVQFSWSNIFPPTADEIKKFLGHIRWSEKKTYIHCHSGVDRTGFAAAVIRMRFDGWKADRAIEEFVAMGRHWWFWWWKYELKKWEQ